MILQIRVHLKTKKKQLKYHCLKKMSYFYDIFVKKVKFFLIGSAPHIKQTNLVLCAQLPFMNLNQAIFIMLFCE